MMAYETKDITAVVAAKPSIPSIKLKALIMKIPINVANPKP
jgi:hypothetical protein